LVGVGVSGFFEEALIIWCQFRGGNVFKC